eukprot:TRINITY_DN23254_c0_g1_i1.p1 TRINITY_DN23254_c0_g1~~TRINITY_DN23254_c0_g1_i1.p1  ORF type:complete len:259 (+),score=47.65 TRINITY_DN23254_c0_g1_i1:256-1032(+)
MGYALLYENMLGSVIAARDKWLKPGGLMLPSQVTLLMSPFTDAERYGEGIDFWKDVYGINMSALIPAARKAGLSDPCVECLTSENILSWPLTVASFDCSKVTVADLAKVEADFSTSSMMLAPLHGFVLWFDAAFDIRKVAPSAPSSDEVKAKDTSATGNGTGATTSKTETIARKRHRSGPSHMKNEDTLVLSTAPEQEGTHWAQTLLYIDEEIPLQQDTQVSGHICLTPNSDNARFLDIVVDYRVGESEVRSKAFTMR